MAIPAEVQILHTTEVPRFKDGAITVEVWVTYQAGVFPPRTVTIPKAQDSPEARRAAIIADIKAAQLPTGEAHFKLTP